MNLRKIVDLDILRSLQEILGDKDALEVVDRNNTISLVVSISSRYLERVLGTSVFCPPLNPSGFEHCIP